jgi:hypothetical protein
MHTTTESYGQSSLPAVAVWLQTIFPNRFGAKSFKKLENIVRARKKEIQKKGKKCYLQLVKFLSMNIQLTRVF